MKIIELRAENIKKLVAVSIKPTGNMVEITGKNGQGKTSVLDAIWWALEGKEAIQATPIRKGATEAVIKLDLGEVKITRTFKSKESGYTTSITVENAEGARFPSPQAVLDSLFGELSIDPLAFTRMKAPDQYDALKRFVPAVDFDEIAKQNKADYEARTNVNRQLKEAKAMVATIDIPLGTPSELIDESKFIADLEAAGKHNTEIETRRARRDGAVQQVTEVRAQIEALTKQADELQAKIDEAPELPKSIDTAAIRQALEAAKVKNASALKWKQRQEYIEKVSTLEAESAALTAKMDEREAAKLRAIEESKIPVEGLEFGDGIVLMNGVPFNQASDAQQLQASIAIAAAMNPKLRVIRVRDGSLLDDEAMKLLADFAEKNDCQIWIERVDSSGRVGFVIDDGHLAAQPQTIAAE